jgi:polyhydroxyalkanoate synthase subunit PhaC
MTRVPPERSAAADLSTADGPISADQLAAFAEQTGRIIDAFWQAQAKDGFSIVDPASVGHAFVELTARLMAEPDKLLKAQAELWQANLALWQAAMQRPPGEGKEEPAAEVRQRDRRFMDPAWTKEPIFDLVRQSYLLSADWLRRLVRDVDGLEPDDRRKVEFYTRQFISAMAPSNFVLTNPAVLHKTRETRGRNLIEGLRRLLDDLERGKGRVQISMTDQDAFEVGRNVATTPGKVIFQNDLMQLIQYAPGTAEVCKRPLLIVPPWINKFYVLDLQPKNSLIKWCVDQGLTVFVISWVNPRKGLAHKDFQDYMVDGPLAALDAIEQATGERDASVLGFCIGGILVSTTLAWLAARGNERIKSATFLASLFDFEEVGEVCVFIDEHQVARIENHVAEKGYLEGHHMADMFNLMRENDLIWSFVVNNYLMGREPPPFDLLYWNADSTRLPATMLVSYLRTMYRQNLLMEPGGITLAGTPIDLRKVRTPTYFLATKDDHIAPWRSCYPGTQAFKGPKRFVLGASGHIAGIVNPPAANKYGYWTNTKLPRDPQAWLAGAGQHAGSWWPDWMAWLARHSGRKVPARQPGDGRLPPLEDAPGSYVKVRASE